MALLSGREIAPDTNVENSTGTDTARREQLVDELKPATDDYMAKLEGLR